MNTTNAYGKKAAGLHLRYIERDGVGEDGKEPDLFNETTSNQNPSEWEKTNTDWDTQTQNEPHNFRMIVSPEDTHELDLTTFVLLLVLPKGRTVFFFDIPLFTTRFYELHRSFSKQCSFLSGNHVLAS